MDKGFLVGIDEVGRGPVAGPVTVCGFKISLKNYQKLEKQKFFSEIKDSKKCSEKKRKEWFAKFAELEKQKIIEYCCLSKSAKQIDKIGISKCIKELIKNILKDINANSTDQILLDGSLKAPDEFSNQQTIIKGDEKIPVISCASIIAKVLRDKKMVELDRIIPGYGLSKHKGYGTKKHLESIRKMGLSEIHRVTYLKNL